MVHYVQPPRIKRVTDGHLPVILCYQGGDRELSVLIKLSRREGRGEVNPSLSILLIYLTYWAHLIPPPPPPLMISCLTCKVKVSSPLRTPVLPPPPFSISQLTPWQPMVDLGEMKCFPPVLAPWVVWDLKTTSAEWWENCEWFDFFEFNSNSGPHCTWPGFTFLHGPWYGWKFWLMKTRVVYSKLFLSSARVLII